MKVKQISFKDYRNLKNAKVEPCSGVNVICGDNAQGKTNFLEAIWLFTGGKSFRGAKDKEIIKFGETKTSLEMLAEGFLRDQLLNICIEKGKRQVTVNRVEQKKASELIGRFCAVIFSPVHLSLVKDGPGVRRKFLDAAICQIQPRYISYFFKYNHVLNQRNSLLRHIKKNKNLKDTLDIWEDKLAEYGAEIIFRRFFYVEELKEHAANFYSGLSCEKETLLLQYKTLTTNEFFEKKDCIKEDFKKKLKKSREEDIFSGFTTKGPHRDDIEIKINNKSARMFASQGQQRSIVLAMKLAEAEIVQKKINESPVILLDDVLSELDFGRQNYLLNSILEKQVFITCCEKDITKKISVGKVFEVVNGEFL